MSNSLKTNNFYNTFTPFLSQNTITAEKTIHNQSKKAKTHQEKFSQSAGKYLTPCALLALPILAIIVSKTHLTRMLFNTDKEYFLAINNEMKGGFIKHISQKFSIAKYYTINKISEWIMPLKIRKDRLFLHITSPENQSIPARIVQRINKYFTQNKIAAVERRTQKVQKVFKKLTENLEKQMQIMEESSSGKIKVLLPNEVLKTQSDNLPRVIDFSRTKNGTNRSEEIRKLINEVKTLLTDKKPEYDKILQKITYSCDDIFDEGVEILIKIRKELENTKVLDPEQKSLIKQMYNNFVKYKYAELIPEKNNLSATEIRQLHTEKLKEIFTTLKKNLPDDEIYKTQISALEKLLTEKISPENMGILEKIRMLLKCNDVKPEILKDGLNVAVFKQYRTNEYLKTKALINELSKELKIATKTEKYILPNSIDEINRGKIFNHAIATVIPAGLVIGKEIGSEKKENKNKRNLFAFLTGALMMFSTHYFAVCSRHISILYGLGTTLLATKVFDLFLPDKKS